MFLIQDMTIHPSKSEGDSLWLGKDVAPPETRCEGGREWGVASPPLPALLGPLLGCEEE